MKVRLGKHGIHVFNRATGANVLLDNVKVPANLWSMAPRHVSIAITNACDLSCAYCYAPKKRAELNINVIKEWLQEIDANGTLGVGFGGGEPTIYPRFAELCEYAATNTSLAISFTTHGHHLTDALLERLKGNVHFVRISMDGMGETYERLRRRPFYAIEKRMSTLGTVVPFGINYVVNADTLSDLNRAIDFAIDIGASELLLLPEYSSNPSTDAQSKVLLALKKILHDYSKPLPLRISEHNSEGMPICDPFEGDDALNSYVHVDANAVLRPSSYERNGFQITETGFMDALTNLKHHKLNINLKV